MSQTSVKQGLWPVVKTELERLFPADIFQMWFAGVEAVEEGTDYLVLGTANDFVAIWLQENYCDLITQKVREAAGRPLEIRIESVEAEPGARLRDGGGSARTEEGAGVRRRFDGDARERNGERRRMPESRGFVLNPRNNFENFIVGPGNQLAHAASIAVAQSPARAYNPLFLYGDTGLGKTHLMHAIAHTVLQADPYCRVVYVSCEKFTNEFIRAIQENTLHDFRRTYRSVDILLIDDVHFLAGKERIQEEFFHTFNELYESTRQICLTSDRPASEISKLESRLVSRFQWGMAPDIQAPDLETRTAILRKKAQNQGMVLPEEILQFLAQRVTRNVRRMEGALVRVASYGQLVNGKLDVETIEKLLHDILQEEAQHKVTIEMIQRKVVEFFDLRMADMSSRRRPSNIAFPRQIAMYLSRILTSHSLQEIGESFGGRDHGTVIHANKTVENMMDQDASVKRNVDYLVKQLQH